MFQEIDHVVCWRISTGVSITAYTLYIDINIYIYIYICMYTQHVYGTFTIYTCLSTCTVFEQFQTVSNIFQIGLECIGKAAGVADS